MMRERVVREAIAVALLLGALLVAVALLSHSPIDPSPFHASTLRESPQNLAGWLGATLSAALFSFIGVTAFVLPVAAAVLGWRLLRQSPMANPRLAAVGWGMLLIALPGFASLLTRDVPFRDGRVSSGGYLGLSETELLRGFAGPVGGIVVLVFLLVVGILLLSGASAGAFADRLTERIRDRWFARRRKVHERRREKEEDTARRRVIDRQVRRLEKSGEYRGSLTVKEVEGRGRFRIIRKHAEEAVVEEVPVEADTEGPAKKSSRKPKRTSSKKQAPKTKSGKLQEEFDFVEDLDSYDLPKESFLEPAEEAPERDSAALIEMSKLITAKCQEFKVRGEVVNIRTGPVITTYEFRLDSGVKISAVQSLSEDLALALRTDSVRIERIPGRATVGIEVPNPDPEVIRLRQLITVPEFDRAQSLLTLSLGVDIRGKPFFSDLSRMPHLLMGGFTGAGKSVGLNAMIMSILYKARPDEVKFILVDPKMVELGVYADIPHLLTPIISNPKKAANALGWAVSEMDDRYRVLAGLGVRNLQQYNQLLKDPVALRRATKKLTEEANGEQPVLEPMPYIVIIIDELADLMITSSRAVEESITRLAQKARAVGVHLVCATQRPSVDILTGIIKANFPCRIAYKVRSRYDSRTILDSMGAEHLLGRGDMLFLPPGSAQLMRLHGPLVTEKEIASVVRYVKRFGKPDYQREVLSHAPLGPPDRGGKRTTLEEAEDIDDPMYDAAARMVVKTRKASASYIQRRLRLGYTRSARLLDMMEKEGLVGPPAGSKGRELLVSENYFGEVDETHELNDG
ncbi:MAG: DNA translocase FtsK 4TM domain-containing protein [Acidobacteria bacterium]|uniref:DNA translocase FtsK 4TM domain-containing protein n=1 Tax=Candidatus Sulfomarinibacter kjeldsenii TaxID=2885994 RepID=A0A8J7C302_9BACT|nr:DNA translocase FtsK 4TM domain-containing protein [Candidatus Sulfomarinibacter kjeldsenii]